MIERLGVDIQCNKALGRDFTIESLKAEGYDAVYLAVGAPDGLKLGLPGEGAEGVTEAMTFLREYNIRGSVPRITSYNVCYTKLLRTTGY